MTVAFKHQRRLDTRRGHHQAVKLQNIANSPVIQVLIYKYCPIKLILGIYVSGQGMMFPG